MRVLFVSGYPGAVIGNRGILSAGVAFLQKPYSAEELGGKIRTLLGEVQKR